ncbi:MAG: LLM class flavin-dependent oxidoreductase, partial [Actinomycetota bacterium]|nr:LLM class flavin-dependent oxidoreductase [Actinomycetota bacterium]
VALDWPPATTGPLLVGAVGPKSLALSGELSDGTIMTGGTTPDQVRAARAIVDASAAAAGRPDHPIVVFLIAATGPGAEARLARELAAWDSTSDQLAGVAGDAQAIAAAVRELAEAGADTVVLQPTEDEPDVESFVAFAAQDVATLLGG